MRARAPSPSGSACFTQTLVPLAREVALVAPVDGGGDAHRDQRPEAGQRHVLVRVPLVALRAEAGLADVAAEHDGRSPLDQLVDHRGGHGEVERQEVAPEAARVGHAQVDLAHRVGEQQAMAGVDDAIEVAQRFRRAEDGAQLPAPRVFYVEMAGYGFEAYVYAFVLPYFRDPLRLVSGVDELVARSDLRSVADGLRGNPKIRHFANRNDFLTTPEDAPGSARRSAPSA
jgi:hypothetical protein